MKIQTKKTGYVNMLHYFVFHVMDTLILFNSLCGINYLFWILFYIEFLVVLVPVVTAGVCLVFSKITQKVMKGFL